MSDRYYIQFEKIIMKPLNIIRDIIKKKGHLPRGLACLLAGFYAFVFTVLMLRILHGG
jgi:hypothetical protein